MLETTAEARLPSATLPSSKPSACKWRNGVPSLAVRLKNVLLRESYGDRRSLRKQLKYHLSQPYDFVFFDGSHYGVYLREFARHGFKTICFFHNVEVDYYQQKYKTTHQPQDKLMVGFIAHNERCCIDHASYLITLNERDNRQLQKRYHRGTNFFANKEAMDYYIKEIAPSVHIPLLVVGNIAEAFQDATAMPNVHFLGRVDDLAPYYLQATAVVAPILSGSGLKTKTVEALRYGKYVIGSAEAFEGIPILNYPGAGCECHNTSDYISLINSLKVAKTNEASLRLFDEQFSTTTQLKRFSEFIMSTAQ